jgi:hypothetical protein
MFTMRAAVRWIGGSVAGLTLWAILILTGNMPGQRKRESNSTFPDAGLTAMLGSMIEMDGWGDGRGVVRGS